MTGESDSRKLQVAVVGLKMGRHHAHAFSQAQRADLRWVVDLDGALASKVADEVGCEWTTDLAQIIDEVDAVSLCLPHHLHDSYSIMAMDKGKHVLVEKPMANTLEACVAMMDAAERNNVKLMVAFPLRYWPEYLALEQELASGRHGEVISVNGFVHTLLEPMPGSWFAKQDQVGGGVFFSHGCHDLDVFISLFGDPLRASYVSTRNGTDWLESEGTAHAIFEFAGGVVGNLSMSWGMRYADQPYRIQVHTTKALLQVGGGRLVIRDEAGERTLYEPPKDAPRSPASDVIDEVQHFLTCVLEDKQPKTDGHDALRSHRVIWDLYANHSIS